MFDNSLANPFNDGEVADVVDPDVADGVLHRGEAHAPFVGSFDDGHSLEDGRPAVVRRVDVVAFAFALIERGVRGDPRPLEDRLLFCFGVGSMRFL